MIWPASHFHAIFILNKAIQKMIDLVLTPSRGYRKQNPLIVIVVTDGKSADSVEEASKNLHQVSITISSYFLYWTVNDIWKFFKWLLNWIFRSPQMCIPSVFRKMSITNNLKPLLVQVAWWYHLINSELFSKNCRNSWQVQFVQVRF